MELIQSVQLKNSICEFQFNNNSKNSKGLLCKILVQDKKNEKNYYFPVLLTIYHSIKENEIISIFYNGKKYPIKLDETRIRYQSEQYDIFFVQIKESDNLNINDFFELNEKIFNEDLLNKIGSYHYEEFQTKMSYAFGTIFKESSKDIFAAIRNEDGIYDDSNIKYNQPIREFIKSTFLNFTNKILELIEYNNFENELNSLEEKEEKINQNLNTSNDTYKKLLDMSLSKLSINDNIITQIPKNSQKDSSNDSFRSNSFINYNNTNKDLNKIEASYSFDNTNKTKKIELDRTYDNRNEIKTNIIGNKTIIINDSEIISKNKQELLNKLNQKENEKRKKK